MHETAIVEGIFNVLTAQVSARQIKRVIRLKLKVGELTAVEATTLKTCFELYAENTIAEGAELVIHKVPLRGMCRSCKKEFAIRDYTFSCGICGSNDIETIAGRELYIESIEVEGSYEAEEKGGCPNA